MDAMASSIKSSKFVLRAQMSSILQSLNESEIHLQSQKIIAGAISSSLFRESKIVSCYLSINREVETSMLVKEILTAGKTFFAPQVQKDAPGVMKLLRIYDLDDLETLPSGVWGIREPGFRWNGKEREDVNHADIPLDLMFLPGVAFGKDFARLGHGKGYYDRFINSYSSQLSRSPPKLVALAFKEQLLDAGIIPMQEHDRKMDYIITADGILQNSDNKVNQD